MAKSIRPQVRIFDSSTNELIDREMNDEEFAQYQADLELDKLREVEIGKKKAEKQAILDRIGLTADELKTILG